MPAIITYNNNLMNHLGTKLFFHPVEIYYVSPMVRLPMSVLALGEGSSAPEEGYEAYR